MRTYQLSVFRPIPSGVALNEGDHLVNVFTIEVDQTLEWVRAHADALARRALRSSSNKGLGCLVADVTHYDALMVA